MSWLRLAGLSSLLAGLVLLEACSSVASSGAVPVPTGPGREVQAADLEALYDEGEARLEAGEKDQVRRLAAECIELATRAESERPGRVWSPYFRALCESLAVRVTRGALGRTYQARALARRLEKDAREAIRRDESYQRGGPLRLLGLFYLRAPRWPLGPGDVEQGTRLLARARERFPDEPLNRLFYAEALLAQDDQGHARRELEAIGEAKLEPRFGRLRARLQGELRG